MADGKVIALTPTSERTAATSSGYAMLIVLVLGVLADAYAIYSLPHGPGGTLNVLTLSTFSALPSPAASASPPCLPPTSPA